MNFKAVIFDKDGVIVDSEPIQYLAFKELLAEYGHTYTEEHHRTLVVGRSGTQSYLIIQKHFRIENLEIFKTKRRTSYRMLSDKHLWMRKGALALIRKLYKSHYPLAVASGSSEDSIKGDLSKFKLQKYFRVTVSGEHLPSKPDPEIFLVTAKKLGMKPKDCIVIEDSQAGVEAAKAAGMYVVAIPHELTMHQDFSIANMQIKSFSHL